MYLVRAIPNKRLVILAKMSEYYHQHDALAACEKSMLLLLTKLQHGRGDGLPGSP